MIMEPLDSEDDIFINVYVKTCFVISVGSNSVVLKI